MSKRPDKRNSKAWAISDRSGFKFRMSEMVDDDGYLVHRSESDGDYSLKKHPLSNMGYYLKGKTGDPFPVPNARPDRDWNEPLSFTASSNIGGDSWAYAVPSLLIKVGSGSAAGVGTATAISLGTSILRATTQGVYTLTGQDVNLIKAKNLDVTTQGAYTLTGVNAGLFKSDVLSATTQGTYALTGQDSSLKKSGLLTSAVGAYTQTGIDVTLTKLGSALEDFESLASQLIPVGWITGGVSDSDRVISETQGTYSWKLTGGGSDTNLNSYSPTYPYSSAGTTATVDVRVVTIPSGKRIRFGLIDVEASAQVDNDFTTLSTTGLFNLSVDFMGLTGGNHFQFFFDMDNDDSVGTFEIHIDNLRIDGVLLDGFESYTTVYIPNTLDWAYNSGPGVTTSQSTSHVTNGTYSYRIQSSDAVTDYISLQAAYDISTSSSLKLDVTVSSIPADGQLFLWAQTEDDGSDYIEIGTSAGTTSSSTLTLDTTTLTGGTLPLLGFYVLTAIPTAADIYVDNLRGIP